MDGYSICELSSTTSNPTLLSLIERSLGVFAVFSATYIHPTVSILEHVADSSLQCILGRPTFYLVLYLVSVILCGSFFHQLFFKIRRVDRYFTILIRCSEHTTCKFPVSSAIFFVLRYHISDTLEVIFDSCSVTSWAIVFLLKLSFQLLLD